MGICLDLGEMMRHEPVMRYSVFFIWTACCSATTPAPYARECALLGRIGAAATSASKASATAISMLERVALGRTSEINKGSEAQFGLTPGELHRPEFASVSVRACALRTIGESDLPAALEFLTKLKAADFADDRTQQIWQAARVAFRTAQFNRISDPQSKTMFLERTVAEGGAVGIWAIDELCDRGSVASLPTIEHSITKRWSGRYADDEIEFCRARVQVVLRDASRTKALGSVLNLNADNDRVVRWAIYELSAMRSAIADAELDRFAAEIDKLPQGSPKLSRFGLFRREIRDIRSRAR